MLHIQNRGRGLRNVKVDLNILILIWLFSSWPRGVIWHEVKCKERAHNWAILLKVNTNTLYLTVGSNSFQSPRTPCKAVMYMIAIYYVDFKLKSFFLFFKFKKDDRINILLMVLFQLKKKYWTKIIPYHPLFLYCFDFLFLVSFLFMFVAMRLKLMRMMEMCGH